VAEQAKTLKESEVIAVCKVEQHGTALTIPEKMTPLQAIEVLKRRMAYDEETVAVIRNFDVFPWDGAVALNEVLSQRYGWATAEATYSFFGKNPPQLRSVEVGYGKTIQVPWGKFKIPGVDAELYTGVDEKRGRKVFSLSTEVKRKYEKEVQALYDDVQTYLNSHSIYRGKAIELDFSKLTDEGLVEPRFMDTENTDPQGLIFSEEVQADMDTNVFTPIIRYQDAKRAKLKFKRGVLMAGPFGVGKTLAAAVAAYHCEKAGIMFVKVPQADQLAQAVNFVSVPLHQPAVIFCEDIDRAVKGSRDANMDTLLNIVDGVDSKNAEIMIVLTTNEVEKINQAMLRPGRLDSVIDVTPPDAIAVQKLLRLYGKGVVDSDADLTRVGEILQGRIPAVIAEVVTRSKLAALKNTEVGTHKVKVDEIALIEAAQSMQRQLDLLYRDNSDPGLPTLDTVFRKLMNQGAADAVADNALDNKVIVKKGVLTKYQTVGGAKIQFE
jgi:transitional endoplasmic reticulum ATPase